jgi:hypothetical protein
MVKYRIGSTDFGGWRRAGLHHHPKQSRHGGAGSLLQSRNGLTEGCAAGFPVSGIEFRFLHPLQQRVCRDANRPGCLLEVPMTPAVVRDTAGREWATADILWWCALVSLVVMVPVAIWAWARLRRIGARMNTENHAECLGLW